MQSSSRWPWLCRQLPGSYVRLPAPHAGSSPGLAPHRARMAATSPAASRRSLFWERTKGLVMSRWPGRSHGLVPNRRLATAGNDLGGSQFSDANGCRELDMRGALLIQKRKAERKQWLGCRVCPDPLLRTSLILLTSSPEEHSSSSASLHLLSRHWYRSHSHLLLGLVQ